ncbi:hypothetical protein [Bifidobacterium miconisargentati]|nr:hypothetical protein [Bifidobacterium miconisargentati]MBW3090441.1 hypothetical protein [Bifidobacterium miconisargentati]
MVLLSMSGGGALLGDIGASSSETITTDSQPTADEVREAESHMSSMFQ